MINVVHTSRPGRLKCVSRAKMCKSKSELSALLDFCSELCEIEMLFPRADFSASHRSLFILFFLQHLLHDCHFLFKYIYFLKKPLKILYHSLHRTLLLHVFPSVFIWLSVFLLSKLWCSERHGSQHQHWFRHVSISCLQKICDLFLFIFFILKSEVSCFKWTPPPGGTTCLLLSLSKSTITFMSSTGIL